MSDDSPMGRDELAVSRAALLILRAIGSSDSGSPADTLHSWSEVPVQLDEVAIRQLAAMPKPVECIASVIDGRVVAHCRPLSRFNRGLWRAHQALATQARANNKVDSATIADVTILIIANGESMVLSRTQLRELEADYLFLGNFSVREDVVNPDAASGVTRVAREYSATAYVETEDP